MMEKIARIENTLREMESVLVAYSGGVDSTLLIYLASRALGDRAAAATVVSPFMTAKEIDRAKRLAGILKVRHILLDFDVFSREEIIVNPPQRCYHCKLAIYRLLGEEAARMGFARVIEATQTDDLSDFRPGLIALIELGIRSPLAEAGLSKADVRKLSEIYNLPGSEQPSTPCLATRIPYWTRITPAALERVIAAEEHLADQGFSLARVRDHFPVAVIEVPDAEIGKLASWPVRKEVLRAFKKLGYTFVAGDLEGYRSGSLLEAVLEKLKRKPKI